MSDDEVDQAKSIIRTMIGEIVQNDASQQQYLGVLFSVSRSLERIADHATHIAEGVIYMLLGQIVRLGSDSRGFEGGIIMRPSGSLRHATPSGPAW